jgi:hypothetical protein
LRSWCRCRHGLSVPKGRLGCSKHPGDPIRP